MSSDSLAAMWENASECYSDGSYAKIRDEIVDCLVSRNLITVENSLLDIGCGRGSFSVPLSRHVGRIICTDISRGMLEHIDGLRLPNVRTLRSDCFSLPKETESDIVLSSLCPPMNSPEGILAMEKLAHKRCIYVSSANPCPGIETEIWNALGSDYSYRGSDTVYPYRFLKSLGRNPELAFFSQESESAESAESLTERFVSKISKYRRLTDEDRKTVRDTVESRSEDGIVYQRKKMVLGLLVWNV